MRSIRILALGLSLTVLAAFTDTGAVQDKPRLEDTTGSVTGTVVFDGKEAGLEVTDAIVYLVGEGLEQVNPAPEKPILNQRDITFYPHIMPLAVDQELEIRNSDGILHNVKTRSRENRPFNKAQVGSAVLKVSFDRPEVITVVCNVHSQMSAYIVVVPNGFFTRVGEDGSYTLDGVPPGSYQLVAWHEDYGAVSTDVVIEAGAATGASVTFAH